MATRGSELVRQLFPLAFSIKKRRANERLAGQLVGSSTESINLFFCVAKMMLPHGGSQHALGAGTFAAPAPTFSIREKQVASLGSMMDLNRDFDGALLATFCFCSLRWHV